MSINCVRGRVLQYSYLRAETPSEIEVQVIVAALVPVVGASALHKCCVNCCDSGLICGIPDLLIRTVPV